MSISAALFASRHGISGQGTMAAAPCQNCRYKNRVENQEKNKQGNGQQLKGGITGQTFLYIYIGHHISFRRFHK